MKVVLTLSDRPSECGLVVDGIPIEDAQEVHASITMEDGPKMTYITTPRNEEGNVIRDVTFCPVIKDYIPDVSSLKAGR